MFTRSKTITLMACLIFFTASGQKEATVTALSDKNQIIKGESVKDELRNRNEYQISLTQEALKQTFLFTVAEISSAPTPTGHAMANKIVFFEKKANSIFMFESLTGKLSTNSVETKVLLAEFPITKETKKKVQFDFKSGMKLFFEKRSMFASEGGAADTGDTVFKITDSFIDSVQVRGKYIFIEQIVRVDSMTSSGTSKNFSRHLKYTLSSYKKNEKFPSKVSNGQQKVGYFEVHPVLEAGTGKSTVHVMKFDIAKPVTYYLTRNIPTEYQQAVKDGILYWNNVFGKEVMKVETLPEGVSAHEPGYHIAQWLHWDTAGFAYANMMADPLTGETLQAHIYMTSVFGKGGLKRAKLYLRKYHAQEKKSSNETHTHGLKLKGFESANICHYDLNKSMADLADIVKKVEESAESDQEKEKIFLRFSQDYVRQVVAHEIGHTVGLRHNFAGSLKTTLNPQNYNKISKEFFMTGDLKEGTIPGGTVMDYTPSMISSMLGAHIRLKREGLSYDKQAIQFGYTKTDASDIDFDVFCTDGDRAKNIYKDCLIWDMFKNPIHSKVFDIQQLVPNFAFTLVNKFSFLDPDLKEEPKINTDVAKKDNITKIQEVILKPAVDAKTQINNNLQALLELTGEKSQFIKIRKEFGTDIGVFEQAEIFKKTAEYKNTSLSNVGGISKNLISPLMPIETNTKLTMKLVNDLKVSFEKQLAKTYPKATSEELTLVKSKINKYFDRFEKEALVTMLKHLNGHVFIFKEEGFGKQIKVLADKILFTESDAIVGTSNNGMVVKRPLFSFVSGKKDLRAEAAQLVGHDFYPWSPSYMRNQKKFKMELHTKHKVQIEAILNTTSEGELSNELFDWLVFEKKRLNKLK